MKNNYPQSVDFKINLIQEQLGHEEDFSIQRMWLREGLSDVLTGTVFSDGLVGKAKVGEVSPEINRFSNSVKSIRNKDEIYFKVLQNTLLYGSKVPTGSDNEEMFQQMLERNTVVLFDKVGFSLAYATYEPEGKAVQEPASQTVIRNPKEGLTERIKDSISQIRRRIKDKSSRIEPLKLGMITKADMALLYMEGIALESNIKEV